MNKLFFLLSFTLLLTTSCEKGPTMATITTEFGEIELKLYDSTPQHKANFIKLVEDGFYEDLLFHRVMPNFMVQGGDPKSKGAPEGGRLGSGGPGYTVPNEISAANVHFRGALSAARQPDTVNPEKKSSGSQFFIVTGRQVNPAELDGMQRRLGISYTEEQKQRYLSEGGYPSLDMDYTVFGEVVTGFDVIDLIVSAERDRNNRPLEDVKMKIKLK